MNIKAKRLIKMSLLFLCFFLITHLNLGTDTITADQDLSGDQTIVSEDGNNELGFYQPKNSPHYYIGMWSPKVYDRHAIWLLNRDTPLLDNYSTKLKVLNGNLVLINDSSTSPIWSTNLNSTTSDIVQVVLLNSGNLVLRSGNSVLWQSFDHLTDTWLIDSMIGFNKITKNNQVLTSSKSYHDYGSGLYTLEFDPNSNQLILKWNRTKQYWASGSWNPKEQVFSLIPEMRFFTQFNTQNYNYVKYSTSDNKTLSGIFIDITGQIRYARSSRNAPAWNIIWPQPSTSCQVYAYCGAFGVCISDSVCDCLDGFVPRSGTNWNQSVYTEGCVRKTQLNCGNFSSAVEKDKFSHILNMEIPADSQSIKSKNEEECESKCLNDCSCNAYTYGTNGCLIWRGDLLNLQKLSTENTSTIHLFVRLSAKDITTSPKDRKTSNNKSGHKNKLLILILIIPVSILLGLLYIFYWRGKKATTRRTRTSKGSAISCFSKNLQAIIGYPHRRVQAKIPGSLGFEEDIGGIDVQFFDMETISAATCNFSDACKIGSGGFGAVYKGIFPGGEEIAVKRLSSISRQGSEEFKNEVSLIAKLQHRNLVRLLGYCAKEDEKMLLYEYMPNKSLDYFLFDNVLSEILDWEKRFDIISGIARGLLYLHHDSRLRIIHRDLKPNNILLDKDLNPKISDFGMARIIGYKDAEGSTNRVVGTYGYMSPEYALHGFFSVKSDVFSFGVIILEIISSKRTTRLIQHEQALMTLPGYAWRLWTEGKTLDLMDETLTESCNAAELLKCVNVALLCVQEDPSIRPTMSSVVIMLSSENPSLPVPKEPGFAARQHASTTSSANDTSSTNEVTLTTEIGR